MVRGTAKWFNAEHGPGFVTPDEPGADVFVHHSVIDTGACRSLEEHQRVVITAGQGPRGVQADPVRAL
ncbi:cold-shock protein [Streptomyces sp. NPDC057616]|uniref:cold-shock protein n=1 Tax=Streptomyces sp. NPDC057616 TaxID=3346183 RepID=UPI003686696E